MKKETAELDVDRLTVPRKMQLLLAGDLAAAGEELHDRRLTTEFVLFSASTISYQASRLASIQPKLLQFKTNYMDTNKAKQQAEALAKTIAYFGR